MSVAFVKAFYRGLEQNEFLCLLLVLIWGKLVSSDGFESLSLTCMEFHVILVYFLLSSINCQLAPLSVDIIHSRFSLVLCTGTHPKYLYGMYLRCKFKTWENNSFSCTCILHKKIGPFTLKVIFLGSKSISMLSKFETFSTEYTLSSLNPSI